MAGEIERAKIIDEEVIPFIRKELPDLRAKIEWIMEVLKTAMEAYEKSEEAEKEEKPQSNKKK